MSYATIRMDSGTDSRIASIKRLERKLATELSAVETTGAQSVKKRLRTPFLRPRRGVTFRYKIGMAGAASYP
jgi:hypothetical protein